MEIAKIGTDVVTEKDILNYLKFTGEIDEITDKVVNNRVAVAGAKKMGLTVTDEELQEAADIFRSLAGITDAKDTTEWLANFHTDIDSLEKFLEEQLLTKKVTEKVASNEKIQDYFSFNMPEFERVELVHIMMSSMDQAREVIAILNDGKSFHELAKELSKDAATKNAGGYLGFVDRGKLPDFVEAKVFNAKKDDILGPFPIGEKRFQVIKLISEKICKLTDELKEDIKKKLFEKWRTEQANIMNVERV